MHVLRIVHTGYHCIIYLVCKLKKFFAHTKTIYNLYTDDDKYTNDQRRQKRRDINVYRKYTHTHTHDEKLK